MCLKIRHVVSVVSVVTNFASRARVRESLYTVEPLFTGLGERPYYQPSANYSEEDEENF